MVGDIKLRLIKGEKPSMETQIRMQDEAGACKQPIGIM